MLSFHFVSVSVRRVMLPLFCLVSIMHVSGQTQSLTAYSLNTVILIDGVHYPCTNSGIQNAINSVPNPGVGLVDASGCPQLGGAAVNITTPITVGNANQIVILRLGAGVYNGSANPLFMVHPRSKLIIPMGTTVQQTTDGTVGIMIAGSGGLNSQNSPWPQLRGGIEGSGLVMGPGDTTSIGVFLGGGSGNGNPAANAANYVEIGSITISGFGTGEQYGDNVYIVDHTHTMIVGNSTAVFIPSGITGTGENIAYHNSTFSPVNKGTTPSNIHISQPGVDMTLDTCSIDQSVVVVDATSSVYLRIYGSHFEKNQPDSNEFVRLSGNNMVELHAVKMVEDSTTDPMAEFFTNNGGHLRIFGGEYLASATTGELVNATGSSTTVEAYGTYGNNFSSEINSSFTGAYIESGTFIFGIGLPGVVKTTGTIQGRTKEFEIDHPLHPNKKYLNYTSVESPEMTTFYNGIATLDSRGERWVKLPDYFEALNRDFHYQLTAVGSPAPGLYIAKEITGNRFKISGGMSGMKVSWQVTGIRHDAYANAHRPQVEQNKATITIPKTDPSVMPRNRHEGGSPPH